MTGYYQLIQIMMKDFIIFLITIMMRVMQIWKRITHMLFSDSAISHMNQTLIWLSDSEYENEPDFNSIRDSQSVHFNSIHMMERSREKKLISIKCDHPVFQACWSVVSRGRIIIDAEDLRKNNYSNKNEMSFLINLIICSITFKFCKEIK